MASTPKGTLYLPPAEALRLCVPAASDGLGATCRFGFPTALLMCFSTPYRRMDFLAMHRHALG
ncbi:MAG: hypothetical protein ACE5H0_13250, partial [Bacteroidota bacterium]